MGEVLRGRNTPHCDDKSQEIHGVGRQQSLEMGGAAGEQFDHCTPHEAARAGRLIAGQAVPDTSSERREASEHGSNESRGANHGVSAGEFPTKL